MTKERKAADERRDQELVSRLYDQEWGLKEEAFVARDRLFEGFAWELLYAKLTPGQQEALKRTIGAPLRGDAYEVQWNLCKCTKGGKLYKKYQDRVREVRAWVRLH